jgi:hypothetical protein
MGGFEFGHSSANGVNLAKGEQEPPARRAFRLAKLIIRLTDNLSKIRIANAKKLRRFAAAEFAQRFPGGWGIKPLAKLLEPNAEGVRVIERMLGVGLSRL